MSALVCPQCGHEYIARTQPLTPKLAAVLRVITTSIRDRGFPPSFEEIAKAMGYRSLSTVHEHLSALERKGWIHRRYHETRSIELLATLDGAE